MCKMCILYGKSFLFEITRDFTYRLHKMHRYTKGVKTMTIKQVNTGAHGRKPRYFIENEGGGLWHILTVFVLLR